MTFSKQILDFYFSLSAKAPLPKGVETIYPLGNDETKRVMKTFFNKYYDDTNPRTYLVGINPGRLGSGITGIGFADAYHLDKYCDIPNDFDKRVEISAAFMFEVIEAYGGVEEFYTSNFFTTVMPLGLLKEGKNYNYYDDKETQKCLEPYIKEGKPTHSTYTKNKNLIEKSDTLIKLATNRGLGKSTIVQHLAQIKAEDPTVDIEKYKPKDEIFQKVDDAVLKLMTKKIKENFFEDGKLRLKPVYKALGDEVSYDDLRVCMLFLD